jgi:lipopolysaccharide/colanic/teichoic acid biosynthesis glycosyltransferase
VRRIARVTTCLCPVVVVLGLGKIHAVQHSYDFTSSSRFAWALGYAAALAFSAYAFGFPDVRRTRMQALLSALGATLLAALGVSALQLVVGDALLPRVVVFGAAAVLVPCFMLCSALAGDAHDHDEERDRVAAVGTVEDAAALTAELHRAPERPATLVATLTPDAAHADDPPTRPLVECVERAGANLVVIDRAAQGDDDVVAQAALLHANGVRVRTLSLFYEQWLGKLPVAELERVSLLFDIGELHAPGYARVKRLLDLALGTAGVIALLVVTPFVLVGNLFANRGSLLYRQARVGRNGQEFEILKFRTMRPATDVTASDPTSEADPRVTRFGGVLRRSHLDELPQVVNVLRGELSIVGPRPEQPHLVERLEGKIPFYGVRHLVRPGLTGWAQVKYHYGADEVDALEKLQYEVFYLRHQSLGLDLRIVARTWRAVLGRDGR